MANKNSVRSFEIEALNEVIDNLIKGHQVSKTNKKNEVKVSHVTFPWSRNIMGVLSYKLGVEIEFEKQDRIRENIVLHNLKGNVRELVMDVLRVVRKDSITNTVPKENHAWFRNQLAGLLCDKLSVDRQEKERGKNLRGDSRMSDETPAEEIKRLKARIAYLETLVKKVA